MTQNSPALGSMSMHFWTVFFAPTLLAAAHGPQCSYSSQIESAGLYMNRKAAEALKLPPLELAMRISHSLAPQMKGKKSRQAKEEPVVTRQVSRTAGIKSDC